MENIRIETENLIIRNYTEQDALDVSYYSQQPNVAYWMSDMILNNEGEALNWIKWINGKLDVNKPFIILAIEHKLNGVCIGVVGIHPKEELNYEVEILYCISDAYQNKGYATEASKALIHWAFHNTSIDKLSAIVKPDNIPSTMVIKKLGYHYIDSRVLPYDGKMCQFDYYQLTKQ